MAISESSLTTDWITPVRFPDGENITLAAVREAIQNGADASGIPVAFNENQVKSGTVFNRKVEDVLVMYNPEHANDYLYFIIRIQYMGKYAFMHIYNMGGSKNYQNFNDAAEGGFLGGLAKAKILAGGGKAKLQAEEQYYAILKDVISNCIS